MMIIEYHHVDFKGHVTQRAKPSLPGKKLESHLKQIITLKDEN